MTRLIWIGAMLLLFSLEAAGQAVGSTATTTGSHLRVREGPSLSAGIITELDKGVTGEVIDAPAGIDWVKLRIPSVNVEGWVHRDFLEIPGLAPRPAAGTAAVPEKTNPKSVPYVFAEVSRPEGRLFVHGHFKEGLPVLLLDERQIQVWRGKTAGQSMYEDAAVGIFPITEVALDNGERLAVDPVLAIVGYPEGYAPVQPAPISGAEDLRRLDAAAHQHSKDLVAAEVKTLGARLARAHSFEMGNQTAYLLEYDHPYAGEYAPLSEHSYVVLNANKAWHVNARCGTTPLVFRLNGRYFITGSDLCCDCGSRAKYVIELADGGVTYINSDWSN